MPSTIEMQNDNNNAIPYNLQETNQRKKKLSTKLLPPSPSIAKVLSASNFQWLTTLIHPIRVSSTLNLCHNSFPKQTKKNL